VAVSNSGSSTVTISQALASGTGFSLTGPTLPTTLIGGQSAVFTATFAPAAAGNATGSIAIASNATNPSLSIPLSGAGVTAGALSSNPTSIAFGNVQVGGTVSRSESLTNTGGSLLHIATATVTGAGFATSGLTAPTTLNAGQSLTFTVTFTPQGSGAASGSLAVTADGSVTNLSVAFTGTGTAPGTLAVSPATANFGSVVVGGSQSQSGTISAIGAGVTVSSVASNNPEFTITGLSLPLTLNSGQSAPFTLTFRPQASGASSGTLTFSSNGTNPSLTESIAGTGTAAPQHSVSLGWNASSSAVVGYNVYRGMQSGGPYAVLNGSPDASTSYTDSSVQPGQTYYYVVTAVDNAGAESVFSNQAQAVIPTP
jgi:HYDIN/CFA65/VesB-like, Ig-like domain